MLESAQCTHHPAAKGRFLILNMSTPKVLKTANQRSSKLMMVIIKVVPTLRCVVPLRCGDEIPLVGKSPGAAGGVLIYGLGEDSDRKLAVLNPLPLKGERERIDQIVRISVDEVPFFRISLWSL